MTPYERLVERRARLSNLLAMDAPEIIVWHAMRLVAKSQREVLGRGWYRTPLRYKVRSWWRYRVRIRHTLAALDAAESQFSGPSDSGSDS